MIYCSRRLCCCQKLVNGDVQDSSTYRKSWTSFHQSTTQCAGLNGKHVNNIFFNLSETVFNFDTLLLQLRLSFSRLILRNRINCIPEQFADDIFFSGDRSQHLFCRWVSTAFRTWNWPRMAVTFGKYLASAAISAQFLSGMVTFVKDTSIFYG